MTRQGSVWSDKVSQVAQIGGIETAVLDNGISRGMRVAWFNTGTGLRFKVLTDRGMDIADAAFNQYNLAWLNHAGFTPPQFLSDKGLDWLRTFGGGLVNTCGLQHVGGPEKDDTGERGVHGRISNTPAEIISIIQPDPAKGQYDMQLTGRMRESNIFGPNLELIRTITATLGSSRILIQDEITNRGNIPAPHMILYHCNFGWPLADAGTKLIWEGDMTTRLGEPFTSGQTFKILRDTVPEHSGNGEEVAVVDIEADEQGNCRCGIYNPSIQLAVAMDFPKSQLPWLTNWQHLAKGEYVTGIEPGSHPPIGQALARERKTLRYIAPGENIRYSLQLEVLSGLQEIQSHLKT
jgi:hypothetical protein